MSFILLPDILNRSCLVTVLFYVVIVCKYVGIEKKHSWAVHFFSYFFRLNCHNFRTALDKINQITFLESAL